MSKNKKGVFIGIFIWILLSALFVDLFYSYKYIIRYTRIDAVVKYNSQRVVVDDDDSVISVSLLNSEDIASSVLEYPKIEDSCYNLCLKVIEDHDNLYLVNQKKKIGKSDTSYEIYRVDFEKESMDRIYVFGDADAEEILKSYLTENQLDYTYTDCTGYCGVENGTPFVYLTAGIQNGNNTTNRVFRYTADETGHSITPLGDSDGTSTSSLYFYTEDGFYSFDNSNRILYSGDLETDTMIGSDTYKLMWNTENYSSSCFAVNISNESIELVTKTGTSLYSEVLDRCLQENDIAVSELNFMYKARESEVLAAFYDGENAGFVSFDGDQMTVHRKAYRYSKEGFLFRSAGVVFAAAATVFFAALYIRLLLKKGSVLAKIISAVIPVTVIISAVAFMVIGNYLTEKSEEDLIRGMEDYAGRICEMSDTAKIADYNNYTDPDGTYYSEIRTFADMTLDIISVDLGNSVLADRDGNFTQSENYYNYSLHFFGFDWENNRFVGPVNYWLTLTPDTYFAPYINDCIKKAAATGESVVCEMYDKKNVRRSCLIYPVSAEDGSVAGAYLISVSDSEAYFDTAIIMIQIVISVIMIITMIILAFLIITGISIHPLKKLQIRANRLTNGEDDCYVPVTGYSRDEVYEISLEFNRMVSQVKNKLQQIEQLRSGYQAFISDSLLRQLGKKSVALLDLNEDVVTEVYMVYFMITDQDYRRDDYEILCRDILDHLSACDGFVAEMTMNCITVMSENDSLFAYALQICENNRIARACMDRGYAWIRIVGDGTQYTILAEACSREMKAAFGQCIENLDSDFVITHRAFEQDDGKLRFRYIMICENQKLYELLIRKNDSEYRVEKNDFENGVNGFYAGEYRRARRNFVRVLKTNPHDEAARYYVRHIDDVTRRAVS